MEKETGLNLLISREEIDNIVMSLAVRIEKDYHDKNPLVICILKGSFVFTSDLVRHLGINLEVEFIRTSSYGLGTQSCGQVKLVSDTVTDIRDRHVIIIEDIIDTGITTSFVFDYLKGRNPASLRICSLLSKPSRRKVNITIDYPGLDIPDKFVVGYGLDCAEKYRNLPEIYFIEEEETCQQD